MKTEALLAHFSKMTPKRFNEMMHVFDSPRAFFEANKKTIQDKLPWKSDLVDTFILWRDEINEQRIEKILIQEQITVLTKEDDGYPSLLKNIYDPPFCLFVRGELALEDAYPLAVVGTRKATPYGKQVTQEIVSTLATHGLTIVSGLALGIDGIAHETTLQVGGKTVAVLGSGINRHHVYPAVHRQLADNIVEQGGAVISEFPPGTIPSKFTFPKRNRIISGLSLGTLVIEAAEKSGALITSSCALDHGREIFAIPHPITSQTGMGPNKLLKEGAHIVTSAEDIIDILNLRELETFTHNKKIIPDTPSEEKLLNYLSREPSHVDALTKSSGLTSSEVNSTLTIMEMKGHVRNIGNMQYVLAR